MKGYVLKTYLVLVVLLLSAFASAQTLTGTVKNVTTGKPASGDEVVLIKLGAGMEEVAHTKTDSKGNFSFKLDDTQGPHLVRAIHQDVPYHAMAPPGTSAVNVEVYDAGKKIDGVEVVADIMRLQVENGQLEVTREFAVQNSSKPPRTQMNDRDLEFYLPEGAQIGEASALTEHGNPLKTAPVQEDERNRYAFVFPLRPGITQFQISYQLPYNGSASVDPRSLYPLQHFVAIVPKAMTFAAAPGASFKPMNDPNQPDANVQLASTTTVGQSLAFKVSGEGILQARVEGSGAQGGGMGAQNQNSNEDRPGGGLGPPIDAPDPLDQYRWYILGGFAVVLAGAAIYIVTRRKAAARAGDGQKAKPLTPEEPHADYETIGASETLSGGATAVRGTPRPLAATRSSTSMLLEGLKEELFQLEVERQQGQISQQEYDQTKAALDQTLQRALKRSAATGLQ